MLKGWVRGGGQRQLTSDLCQQQHQQLKIDIHNQTHKKGKIKLTMKKKKREKNKLIKLWKKPAKKYFKWKGKVNKQVLNLDKIYEWVVKKASWVYLEVRSNFTLTSDQFYNSMRLITPKFAGHPLLPLFRSSKVVKSEVN